MSEVSMSEAVSQADLALDYVRNDSE